MLSVRNLCKFSCHGNRERSLLPCVQNQFNPKMSLDLETAVNDRGVDFERSFSQL